MLLSQKLCVLVFENTKMPQTRGDLGFCGSHAQRLFQVTTSSLPICLIQLAQRITPDPTKWQKHTSHGVPAHWWRSWKKSHILALTEATQPVFSREFGHQLSTDFIYLFKSVLCHSVQQPFPYLRPVLGRDVPANVPSATAVDDEGIVDAEGSRWCAPPEHHSLKTFDFLNVLFMSFTGSNGRKLPLTS